MGPERPMWISQVRAVKWGGWVSTWLGLVFIYETPFRYKNPLSHLPSYDVSPSGLTRGSVPPLTWETHSSCLRSPLSEAWPSTPSPETPCSAILGVTCSPKDVAQRSNHSLIRTPNPYPFLPPPMWSCDSIPTSNVSMTPQIIVLNLEYKAFLSSLISLLSLAYSNFDFS